MKEETKMEKLFDLLSESDLTDDLLMLRDVCGMETVKLLLLKLNGMNFYIPKISHLDSFVLKYIKQNKDKTTKKVASELGVSEPYLKKLIRTV